MKHAAVSGFIRVGFVVWGAWWALAAFAIPCAAGLQRFEFEQPQMGTTFRLVFYASDPSVANSASKATFARIGELNGVFSDYSPSSEARRLADTADVFSQDGVAVSNDFWKVLIVSDHVSRSSGGAFDVTVGPLTKLWRRARRQQKIPDAGAIAKAQASVGFDRVRLLQTNQSVAVDGENRIRFDFGGIAKGYAADEALTVLAERGIESVLVDAGGDLRLGAPPPGKRGWKVAVALDGFRESGFRESGVREVGAADAALLMLSLSDCGVATSGDTWQYVESDGKRYSHIIDPRSGYGLTNRTSATIIASDATLADGLASAVSVLGAAEGVQMLETFRILDAGGTTDDRPAAAGPSVACESPSAGGSTANNPFACGRMVTYSPKGRPISVRTTPRFASLPRAE